MDLKTWFKGLGVFVLSSLITAVTASQLDPRNFNLSRQGMARLGAMALIIGLKSLILYLKQSPLPTTQQKNSTHVAGRTAGAFLLVALLPASIFVTGCVNSWERDTYAALAAGKALIDCAVAGYNHFNAGIQHACIAQGSGTVADSSQFYLPQTRDTQQAIDKARQVQIAAVEAFEAYAVARLGKDSSVPLSQKQDAVNSYLRQLPQLLSALRALFAHSPHPTTLSSAASPNPGLQLLQELTPKEVSDVQ